VVVLVAVAAACAEPDRAPASPDEAALELFRLAGQDGPDPDRVDRLFGPPVDARRRAALHDALERLREASEPVVQQTLALEEGGRRVIVDLAARLPGDGSARFSVVVERVAADWRVTWFQGPGVGWPPGPQRRDAGLSTSPPPRPSRVR
jgi:hypothetical protein